MTIELKHILYLAAAVATSTAAPARATTCTQRGNTGHYYAILEKFNATNNLGGASVLIATSSLTASDDGTLVNHELWYGLDGAMNYWVEVGVHSGWIASGLGPINDSIFWADNRNGGGYHEHYSSASWSFNDYYQAEVVWTGQSCAWYADFGGVNLGTSGANCGQSTRSMEAGLESSNDSPNTHVGGNLNDWLEKGNTGWVSGWESPSLFATCPADIDYTNSISTEEKLHGPF